MSERKNKILIVDDEEDILEIISYNLEKEGYLTETAGNGMQALKKIQYFKPDLILLDIMMPHKDGMETLKELRRNPAFENTIIICVPHIHCQIASLFSPYCYFRRYILLVYLGFGHTGHRSPIGITS